MPFRSLIAACLLVVSWSVACEAIVIRHDRSDSQYRALGMAHPSVGQLITQDFFGSALCSGTLIAPEWVLTAAHCVDAALGATFTVGGNTYQAAEWYIHEDWFPEDPMLLPFQLVRGYDIALVRLSEPVANVTPAARYRGFSELGKIGTAVGFGATGTGNLGYFPAIGYGHSDGLKRGAQNMIDAFIGLASVFPFPHLRNYIYIENEDGEMERVFAPHSRIFLSDFDGIGFTSGNFLGSNLPLHLEGSIAPGDSGGAVFITTDEGIFLAGVNSFGTTNGHNDGVINSAYGDITGHTRVSMFNDWIDDIIGMVEEHGQLPYGRVPATALIPIPEPSSAVLLTIGCMALIALRRRVRRD